MSDPQQSAPPSYYATTRLPETGAPPPPPPARRGHGWLFALIGGGVLLFIVLGIGAVIFGLSLFQGQRAIPKLLGDDTQLYVSLTPNLSAVPGVQRLQAAYPQLFVDKDTSSLDKQLDELLGVKFKDDVQPWLGSEMAIAVSGVKDISPRDTSSSDALAEKAKVAIILASRDKAKAQAFLDKQRTNRGDKGQQFDKADYKGVTVYEQRDAEHSPLTAFAMVRDYVVFASDKATINAMLDRDADGKATLDDSPRFKAVVSNLPKAAVGYLYIDGVSVNDILKNTMDSSLDSLPEARSQELKDQLNNIKALQSLGVSMSVDPDGIQFDSAVNVDASKFDADMKAQFDEARTPIDAERLKGISHDAVALATFRLPSTLKDQILKAIKGDESGEQRLQEMEDQIGINLEHDVLDWLNGDASLVILPGEKLGDVTLPATGYLSLHPKDRNAAEAGMEKIRDAFEKFGGSSGVAFEEEKIGDVSWQVIREPQSQQTVAGYGFNKDDLVIAFGKGSLDAGGGKATPITDDPNFKLVSEKLPKANAGMVYMNVGNIVDIVDQLGVGREDSPEQEAFRKNIKPIKAIGLAGEPGIDKDGIARARLFIYISDK
jgi:hypothetical protein